MDLIMTFTTFFIVISFIIAFIILYFMLQINKRYEKLKLKQVKSESKNRDFYRIAL